MPKPRGHGPRAAWTHENRLRLIQTIKQFEVIWRPASNNYRMVAHRREAYNQVHQHFAAADGYTVEDIREQWRNLRDVFYKRYELMASRAQRGEPLNRVRPCWRYFDDLKFLASEKAMGTGKHPTSRRALCQGSLEILERKIEQSKRQMAREKGEEDEEEDGDDEDDEEEVYDEDEEQQQSWQMHDGGLSEQNFEGGENFLMRQQQPEALKFKESGIEQIHQQQLQQQQPEEQRLVAGIPESAFIVLETDQHQQQMGQSSQQQQQPVEHIQESPMAWLQHSIDQSIQQQQQQKSAMTINKRPTRALASNSAGPSSSSNRIVVKRQQRHFASPASQKQLKVEKQQRPPTNPTSAGQQPDRFKYFGAFVETAVRDLDQQSPELARRLMKAVYTAVSKHQQEGTELPWEAKA